MRRLALSVVLVAAACGGGSPAPATPEPAPVTTAPDPAAPAIAEGNGWVAFDGGFRSDVADDARAEISLNAEAGGRGMQRFELPAGASRATLTGFDMAFTQAGTATISVHGDAGGAPSEAPLVTATITITAAQTSAVGSPARWARLDLAAPIPVTGPFWLVYETSDGKAAVGARNGGEAQVFYAPPGGQPQPVPYTPHIRATLTDVQ